MKLKKRLKIVSLNNNYKILVNGNLASYDGKKEISLPYQNLILKIFEEIENNFGKVPKQLSYASLSYNSVIKKECGFKKTINELLEYFHCDLICYRAESPKELKSIQKYYWDPIVLKMKKKLNINLKVFIGISYFPQNIEDERKIKIILNKLNEFELTVLENFIRLSGSFSVSLLVFLNCLNVQSAWKISILDEMWQMEKWGIDKENFDILNKKKNE